MSYTSKRTIVSMAAGLLFSAAYTVYALGKNAPGPETPESLQAWALGPSPADRWRKEG
jgi:hypothetical protein